MQLSWPVKRAKPLIDCHENLNQLKVDESAREFMRVDESWRWNESESCDSHPLSLILVWSGLIATFIRPVQLERQISSSGKLIASQTLVWPTTLIKSRALSCTLISFEFVQILMRVNERFGSFDRSWELHESRRELQKQAISKSYDLERPQSLPQFRSG